MDPDLTRGPSQWDPHRKAPHSVGNQWLRGNIRVFHKAYLTCSSHRLQGSLIHLRDNAEPCRVNQLPLPQLASGFSSNTVGITVAGPGRDSFLRGEAPARLRWAHDEPCLPGHLLTGGRWGSGGLRDLIKDTQLVKCRIWIHTQHATSLKCYVYRIFISNCQKRMYGLRHGPSSHPKGIFICVGVVLIW